MKIGIDKIYHFFGGIIIFILVAIVTSIVWIPPLAVLIVAFAKEAYDKWGKKQPSPDWIADIVATVVGVIPAGAIVATLQHFGFWHTLL